MRFTLPRRWRRFLSDLMLSLADRTPPGTFQMADRLRDISERRRKDARRVVDFVASSPHTLRYLGFALVELYPDEVRQQVEDAARKLFPSRESEYNADAPLMVSGRLGRLCRARPAGLFIPPPGNYAFFPAIPSWVAYIDVSIVHEYPSSFMVVADVVTTDEVDEPLREHMRAELPGDVELHNLRRFWRLGHGYMISSAGRKYSDMFQRELARLRREVQRLVFERLMPRGYFLTHDDTLPAIELLDVAGGDSDADNWVNATSGLLHMLGLGLDRDYYAGDKIMLSVPRDLDAGYPPIWRVVVRPGYRPRTIDTVDESRTGMTTHLQENLRETLPSLAITGHHDLLAALLKRFRRRVYFSRRRPFDIRRQAALYEEILEERTFFLRSKRDFENRKLYREPNTLLRGMRYRTMFMPNATTEQPADEGLRADVQAMFKALAIDIENVKESYSDVLAARNWRATNRLSRRALYISTSSLIVAVVFGIVRANGNAPLRLHWPPWQTVSSTNSPAPTAPTPPSTPSPAPARSPVPKRTP